MSQPTFTGLSPERQKEILDTAMEEFVINSYEDASLNRIIEQCGVAKGSFYRYFDGKQELFHDLIDYARSISVANFERAFSEPVEDIFEAWKEFYRLTYAYDRERPLYTGFLFLSANSRDRKETYTIRRKNRAYLTERIKSILIGHQRENRIDSRIDPEFLAYALLGVHEDVFEYIGYRFDIDFHERAKNRLPLFDITAAELESVLGSYRSFLERGAETI